MATALLTPQHHLAIALAGLVLLLERLRILRLPTLEVAYEVRKCATM